MPGLYHTLNIGAEALFTSRQGVDTAGHNIANAQTDGYSRQRVNAEQRKPLEARGIVIGNGVFVKNITRAHDQFLEKQINKTNQDKGFSDSRQTELKALEGIYSPELNASISDELSGFFNAVGELSNFPEELTVRTHVREAAQNLVSAFRRIDSSLKVQQANINQRIMGETDEVNILLNQIADLNLQISAIETTEAADANDLRDQQDRLLQDLSTKMNVNYYQSDQGMLTIMGPNETLLVDKGYASQVGVAAKNGDSNLVDIVSIDAAGNTKVITNGIENGKIKGYLDVRDNVVESLLAKNNEMAFNLKDRVNEVHRQGFGLKDYGSSMGRDFFTGSDSVDNAAETIDLSGIISESTDAISIAATPGAPGDNVIANNLMRLEHDKIMDNGKASFKDFYANYVGSFGLDVVRSEHIDQANNILMGDLKARREAVSGVSMDEEAMNLLKWQANFTASSRVITTVDEMLETVLALKR